MSIPQLSLINNGSFSLLPAELVETLNKTYFLHRLVTEPATAIPPGKSLLSMMTHAGFHSQDEEHKNDASTAIANKVKEVAHKAFWSEAVDALSSSLPSVQLQRLRGLYLDLHDALSPLFPPNHHILVSLSSHLPPTSSPLHSTLNLLNDILVAFRERCAPIRDAQIDSLRSTISLPPPTLSPESTPSPLAEFVIDHIKSILALAEDMKADLGNFVLGSMTEAQLVGVLSNNLKMRERELVLRMWGSEDTVRNLWRIWVAETTRGNQRFDSSNNWIPRLLQAVESDKPVFCAPPTSLMPLTTGEQRTEDQTLSQSNRLPAQLFFFAPALVNIQNYLQAIVIAAALQMLAHSPISKGTTSMTSNASNPSPTGELSFLQRIWALLSAEIDSERDTAETKVINLADEVVRARQTATSSNQLQPDEERRIRETVERTLRSSDPVFLLLRKRLVDGLEKVLLSKADAAVVESSIPAKLQTGRDVFSERPGKRPRLVFPDVPTTSTPSRSSQTLTFSPEILGFQDDVLRKAISDVCRKLSDCIAWTETVWGDLV